MKKLILLTNFTLVLLFALSGKAYTQTTLSINDVDFDAVNGIITGYKGSATDIIIPESFTVNGTEVTVTGIQYYAFQKKGLTAVSFPNTLTAIKFLAFAHNLLSSVTLPSGLKELGSGAFTNNRITEINGVPSNGTFYGLNPDGSEDNTKLVCYGGTATQMDFIPGTVTQIQSYAFARCGLTSVEIPNGVVSMGDGAFEGNELTTLVLPNSVTSFASSVFKGNKLTSVTLSENMTLIGFNAFEDNLLKTLVIPEGVTNIGVNAFKGNQLTSVTLPNSLLTIQYNAFQNNEIASINLPAQLREIGFNAFQYNKLSALTIPASVKEMGSYGFSFNLLSAVTFEANSNLMNIAASAFSNNASLTGIVMPSHAHAQFSTYVDANGVAYAPGASITDFAIAYRAKILKTISAEDVSFNTSTGTITSYNGTATDIIIPDNFNIDGTDYAVKEIGNSAFNYKEISSVVFPDNLQRIGNSAFYFNRIAELTIPENCEVGTSAFGYNRLKTVTIPASMTEIPNACFSYNRLTELSIPATVTSIGSGAFAYNSISTLNLNEGLIEIGIFAFGNSRLTSVSIPNSVVSIDEIAFARNQIAVVNITDKVLLGGGAFASNKIVTVNGALSDGLFYKRNGDGTIDKTILTSYGGTESVIDFLSNDIIEIGNYAFRQCGVTSIVLPNALSHIGESAFYQTGLRSITFPNTLKHISNHAFWYSRLTSVAFPKSIEYIGTSAFASCNLTSVTFENESTIKTIGSNAFESNYNLKDPIVLPTSAIPDFINFYDRKGTVYAAGTGFLNDAEGCYARYKKVLSLDDVVFDENTGTITNYIGTATDIIIPESFQVNGAAVAVTNIGPQAFAYKKLMSVEMVNSITAIGDKAFFNNTLMEKVILGTGLITIGDDAFQNSLPATGIDLPNTGTWHSSYYYALGTEVSKIDANNNYKRIHRVYMVNFVDHDATVLKTETLLHGASATAPTPATRTGYTFTGWDVAFDKVIADMTVTAQYAVVTSIDRTKETAFKLYPNPVQDMLYVEIGDEEPASAHTIAIYNIAGQLVYTVSESSLKMSVSVADWDAGTYFIIVNNKRSKFIKL